MASSGRYDILVLGGGTAGCVLAARLSENADRSVCLVEAGPDYGAHADGAWPEEMLDARGIPETHDWRDEDGSIPVARIIGGCSSHNLCFWIRPAASDWDEWSEVSGDTGWSAAAIAPHIERVESTMALRRFEPDEVSPWLRTCIAAAEETGLGALADVNDHTDDTGLGPMPMNVVGTERWNAAFAYLDDARTRPNLTVLDRCLVDRIDLDGDRALGTTARREGSELRLRGETVVLAAGSYSSPAVLMRSGIGPAEDLGRHGIAVATDLPVGERLRDHFRVPLRLAPSREMQRELDRHAETGLSFFSQGLGRARSSRAAGGLWDLHLMVGVSAAADAGYADRDGNLLVIQPAHVRPSWTGSVRLRSSDPEHLPAVTPHDLNDDGDMGAILDGLELCDELIQSRAARGAWEEQLVPAPELTGAELREHCASAVAPYFHPVGTCAMGRPGDGGSVVDSSGRVHGYENLHVADASIMPAIPRANTNLPVLVAAERIANLLA